jgi:hypothetical protein
LLNRVEPYEQVMELSRVLSRWTLEIPSIRGYASFTPRDISKVEDCSCFSVGDL